MEERMTCRVVIFPAPGGRRELVLYHPGSDRHTHSIRTCGPDQGDIDRAVYQTKAQLERAGNDVEVVGLGA